MKKIKKQKYIKPKLEIIKINKDQIIVTSGPAPTGNGFGTIRSGYNIF